MAPNIPDRWCNYKPIGKKIEGTRFIAFKVPLKEHISKSIESDIRLDGSILLEMVPNLGLIIDLTNTYRYYNPKFFVNEGVEHKKLMIPGHEIPSKELINRFNMIVKEFKENNTDNDKLIGVHCTHGVNRTGFLICNYMISEMTIEPKVALKRFANARGHQIERKKYVDALLLENNVQSSTAVEKLNNWRERDRHSDTVSNFGSFYDTSRSNYHRYGNFKNGPVKKVDNNDNFKNVSKESYKPYYNNRINNNEDRTRIANSVRTTSHQPKRLDYYNARPSDERPRFI